jgi:hypothetical protein
MYLYINKPRMVKQGAHSMHLPGIGLQQENTAGAKVQRRRRNDPVDKVKTVVAAVQRKNGFPANLRGKVVDFGGGDVGGIADYK